MRKKKMRETVGKRERGREGGTGWPDQGRGQ